MNTDRDGGPAFPHVGEQFNHDIGERETVTTRPGMTLRDAFAIAALPAEMARWRDGHPQGFDGIAKCTWDMADAMLKERAK